MIRNAPTRLMGDLGYGEGYVYAHSTDDGVGGLDCLPEALAGRRFYKPRDRGFERDLAKRLEYFERLREKARMKRGSDT